MIKMAHVEDIRKLLHVEGRSQRQVAQELGISRHTVAKYANQTDVPKYNRQEPYTPTVMTAEFRQQIDRLLAENETLSRKQRWIGHTIFWDLQQAGYTGSEPTVRRYVTREGARLLFQFLSAKYETGSLVVTTNLEFREWADVFQEEKMTAAQVDRLTHRAHLLNMNGDSYRFRESRRRAGS